MNGEIVRDKTSGAEEGGLQPVFVSSCAAAVIGIIPLCILMLSVSDRHAHTLFCVLGGGQALSKFTSHAPAARSPDVWLSQGRGEVVAADSLGNSFHFLCSLSLQPITKAQRAALGGIS